MTSDDRELAPGLWQFCAVHPDWTEQEGGEDGWDPQVTWWALRITAGLVLIDPLLTDFAELDQLVQTAGGCAGIVRTIHWHERSIAEAAARYRVAVWAGTGNSGTAPAPDHVVGDRAQLWDGIEAFALGRDDELALWLPSVAALVFGDAILGRDGGALRLCPPSWESHIVGGREGLRERLRGLPRLPVERVLVAHGPSVTTDATAALQAAIG